MAIKILHDGYVYECETPQEAADLTHALDGAGLARQPKLPPQTSGPKGDANRESIASKDLQKMWAELTQPAKKILIALRDSETGLDTDELAKAIGAADAQHIKFSTKTISAVAKRHDIAPERVVARDRGKVHGKSRYVMSDAVRKALAKYE
jgi:hypothetical protein